MRACVCDAWCCVIDMVSAVPSRARVGGLSDLSASHDARPVGEVRRPVSRSVRAEPSGTRSSVGLDRGRARPASATATTSRRGSRPRHSGCAASQASAARRIRAHLLSPDHLERVAEAVAALPLHLAEDERGRGGRSGRARYRRPRRSRPGRGSRAAGSAARRAARFSAARGGHLGPVAERLERAAVLVARPVLAHGGGVPGRDVADVRGEAVAREERSRAGA